MIDLVCQPITDFAAAVAHHGAQVFVRSEPQRIQLELNLLNFILRSLLFRLHFGCRFRVFALFMNKGAHAHGGE